MSGPAENTAGIQRGRPFARGESGNPAGKPRGARNKVAVAIESLMGRYGEQVAARMVKRAVDGDVGAARLILDRVAPIRRGRPVHLNLPNIEDAASVMTALAALLNEVARGKLTPEEAEAVSAMLSTYLKTVETADIDRRLRELESRTIAQK